MAANIFFHFKSQVTPNIVHFHKKTNTQYIFLRITVTWAPIYSVIIHLAIKLIYENTLPLDHSVPGTKNIMEPGPILGGKIRGGRKDPPKQGGSAKINFRLWGS